MGTTQTGFNVNAIRKDFPNLGVEIRGKKLVYLDNAATTLKPQSVIDAVNHHYSRSTSNVHRGVHYLSEKATAEFEGTRANVRDFINAQETSEIIFTKGTTEGINLVAQSYGRAFLKEGDEVLISEMEHHSNIVPWQMLCKDKGCILKVIPMNDNGELIVDELVKLINEKTKFISLVYISNSLGTINPIKEIIARANERSIPILIDAAQAVSIEKIDVKALNCDFLVFSGHKIYGPTGVGVLYGKKEMLMKMSPYQGGGDMIKSVTFENTIFNDLPYKFEAGTPNVAGVIGLGAAIDYVNKIGIDHIKSYKAGLLAYATDQLQTVEGLRLIGTAKNKTSILSFVLKDIHAHDIGTIVDEEGIAIRTGHHCTQPVMKHFGVPATSRASLTFYNTNEEVDRLVDGLNKAIRLFQ